MPMPVAISESSNWGWMDFPITTWDPNLDPIVAAGDGRGVVEVHPDSIEWLCGILPGCPCNCGDFRTVFFGGTNAGSDC
jgi:hypothetical protein